MAFELTKGHAALRRDRISTPSAGYFLTLCTEARRTGLDEYLLAVSIVQEMRAMETEGTWVIRCGTIMPDHIHLFVMLGQRLSLGKSVQRLKAKTAITLRSAALKWGRGFFDH
jgi:putative transposase